MIEEFRSYPLALNLGRHVGVPDERHVALVLDAHDPEQAFPFRSHPENDARRACAIR